MIKMNRVFTRKRLLCAAGIGLCALLCVLPPPEPLARAALAAGSDGGTAMRVLGGTVLAICWWAGEVTANWIVALVMMLSWVLLGGLSFSDAFSGFAGSSLWLILGAFCVSAGVSKTGLFRRISWQLIRLFSPTFQGQALALLLGGTLCSPMIPSSTAKGVLGASIARNIADALGYEADSPGRCGLFIASYIGFSGTACAFMSGSIHTYMIYDAIPEGARNAVTWVTWLFYSLPWLAVVLVGSFLMIKHAFSPDGHAVLTPEYVNRECEKLGSMGKQERISAGLLFSAVLLWILGTSLNLSAAVTALGAACLFFVTGILDWDEIATAIPWGLFIFMGGVQNLGNVFSLTGVQDWLKGLLMPVFTHMSHPAAVIAAVSAATLLLHMVLASQTATIAVLMAILAPVALSAGMNPFMIGFVILVMAQCWFFAYQNAGYTSVLSGMHGTLTHRRTVGASIGFALISGLGCLACLPVWYAAGLV